MESATLSCDEARRSLYEEMMSRTGIAVAGEGALHFVEAGSPVPEKGPVFLFRSAGELAAILDRLGPRSEARPRPSRLVVRDKDGFRLMEEKSVLYFVAESEAVRCVSEAGRFEIQKKLYELELELRASDFVRIHKSLIVNVQQIRQVFPYFGGRLLLRLANGAELEVARSYVPEFKEFIHF